jgi:transcriptional regulator with XRE-family HTH domain
MTLMAVAVEAHISTPNYVWRLEQPGARPGVDVLVRLADALHVPLDDLFECGDADAVATP